MKLINKLEVLNENILHPWIPVEMQSFVKLFNFNPYGKIIFTKHMRDWRFSQYLLKIGISNSTKFKMNMCEALCLHKGKQMSIYAY